MYFFGMGCLAAVSRNNLDSTIRLIDSFYVRVKIYPSLCNAHLTELNIQ
uniref:Uncharacterized protein n=1 Tax=Anguilla anguilla TaxID=7936 RepID=A0A0E9V4P3_ANGAN